MANPGPDNSPPYSYFFLVFLLWLGRRIIKQQQIDQEEARVSEDSR